MIPVQNGTPFYAAVACQPLTKLMLIAVKVSSKYVLFRSMIRVSKHLFHVDVLNNPNLSAILWFVRPVRDGTRLVAVVANQEQTKLKQTKLRLNALKVSRKFALFQ